MALVTAAQIRDLIPQLQGSADDTRLGVLGGQAESALARWMGFPRADDGTFALEDKTYTFYVHGPRRRAARELTLPIRPVVSITSIYQDSDESYTTLVASSDYLTDRLVDGVVMLAFSPACGAWLTGDRPIRVICVAGYATAPDHVVQAVAYQVQYALGQARTGGQHSVSMAGKSATAGYSAGGSTAGAGIDPRAAALLASDRLWENAIG